MIYRVSIDFFAIVTIVICGVAATVVLLYISFAWVHGLPGLLSRDAPNKETLAAIKSIRV
jgi:hypothetical protein